MKFAEHLSAHITPEWRKQYIQYEAFKEMLYAAQDQAPSIEGEEASCPIEPLAHWATVQSEALVLEPRGLAPGAAF
ncbi:hypothetical protein GJAV_G00079620 [Gymnothorax javanicus]|nr:hypothetical protein GJAV_G00079620 [Gymnothorax javanicus]